jgi:hypothetical protein
VLLDVSDNSGTPGRKLCIDSLVLWHCMAKYDTMNTLHHNQHKRDVTLFSVKFLWVMPFVHLLFSCGLYV